MSTGDLSRLSMFELFCMEVDNQKQVLTPALLALETDPLSKEHLEISMRSAHSLKGAARIIGLTAGVRVAHVLEECLVKAQQGALTLSRLHIDSLLEGMDLLQRIASTPESSIASWNEDHNTEIDTFCSHLDTIITAAPTDMPPALDSQPLITPVTTSQPHHESLPADAALAPTNPQESSASETSARVLRVTADNLNRLLALSGESLVESRRMRRFSEELLRLKRLQYEAGKSFSSLREKLSIDTQDETHQALYTESLKKFEECQRTLTRQLEQFESYDYRVGELANRLYHTALSCRMRPFSDGTASFPRQIRDLGKLLGKYVNLRIKGENTQVDRDILERLDAPIGHLLRNAVDHGLEFPDERTAAGKPQTGTLILEACHNAGSLHISVSDDGRGIDIEGLRQAVIDKKLVNTETAQCLTHAELLEFLFLPGFTLKDSVTEISGRGVGLDVVHDMMRQLRGHIRIHTEYGKGTRFQLQLPLTLSVLRSLLVSIAGETYAFPLAGIDCTLKLPKEKVELVEGRQYFSLDGKQYGLIAAHQVLEKHQNPVTETALSVLVLANNGDRYGLVIERFLGERELVVQPLDPRLGKIQNVLAGSVLEDGNPVLIIDIDDMLRSVDKLISLGQITNIQHQASLNAVLNRKRVLVVDDSLTVRELERKLLDNQGYLVEVAVDGMDGWNAVRTGRFDLVITDIDMPRMDGIELVSLIKKDPHLNGLTVMIVSYKDREEDRMRGLEAGADYYLTKGSFHEETLLQAVTDLIGEANA